MVERYRAKRPPQWWHDATLRLRAVGWVVVVAIAVGWGLAPTVALAQDEGEEGTPISVMLRLGGAYTHYTTTYRDANDQFASLMLSQHPASVRADFGRSERYGDVGWGYGLSLRYDLPRGWWVGAGAASGTGKVVHPEYRVDASVGHAFLRQDNLHVTLGYTHEQSKAENSYDSYAVGVEWWSGPHWIAGGHFNYDIGQPGDTITRSGGLGMTWFTWRERYIGVYVFYGDINYTQVGPTDFLVAYTEAAIRLHYTEYFDPKSGIEFRFDAATNEFWDLYGVMVAIFKEW